MTRNDSANVDTLARPAHEERQTVTQGPEKGVTSTATNIERTIHVSGDVRHAVTSTVSQPDRVSSLQERGGQILASLSTELLSKVKGNAARASKRLEELRRDVKVEMKSIEDRVASVESHLSALRGLALNGKIQHSKDEDPLEARAGFIDYISGGIAFCSGRELSTSEQLSNPPREPKGKKIPDLDNVETDAFLKKFTDKAGGTLTGL